MARYTGPRTRIARKFGEAIFGPDKVLRRTILLDNMVTPEKERLLNTVSSFVRSKKQNTLMAYWRSNLETYSKKLHALKVLPVRCFFNC